MDPIGLESTFIRESHSALMSHVASRKYPLWLKFAAASIGLAGAGLSLVVVMTISSDAHSMIYGSVFSGKAVPAPSVDWMLAGTLGLIVVPIVAWNASLKVAAPFWPILAEYVGLSSIQFSFDEDDTGEKLSDRAHYRIESAVLRGTIGAGRPFDPANFLRQEAVRVRWMWLAVTIALMLVNIWLFHRAAQP